jgi:transposase
LKTFLKDKDKVLNAMELPYSNAKLEATNNLIKALREMPLVSGTLKTLFV